VQSHAVILSVVYIFHYIYFAIVGPVRALCPEGGPDRAPERHMDSIHDKQTTRTHAIIAQNLHARPPECGVIGSIGGVVNFDYDIPHIIHCNQTELFGLFLGLE